MTQKINFSTFSFSLRFFNNLLPLKTSKIVLSPRRDANLSKTDVLQKYIKNDSKNHEKSIKKPSKNESFFKFDFLTKNVDLRIEREVSFESKNH